MECVCLSELTITQGTSVTDRIFHRGFAIKDIGTLIAMAKPW